MPLVYNFRKNRAIKKRRKRKNKTVEGKQELLENG
jgi:hypothetical protein